MTFYAGQERCQRLGGHLAHVNSLREQLFLEDFLKQMLRANQQQGNRASNHCVTASFSQSTEDRTLCLVLQLFWV